MHVPARRESPKSSREPTIAAAMDLEASAFDFVPKCLLLLLSLFYQIYDFTGFAFQILVIGIFDPWTKYYRCMKAGVIEQLFQVNDCISGSTRAKSGIDSSPGSCQDGNEEAGPEGE